MTSEVLTHTIVARYSEETTRGTLESVHFGEEARLKRSLKTAGVCVLVALVCL